LKVLEKSLNFFLQNCGYPYSVRLPVTSWSTAKMVRDRPMVTMGSL